MVSCICFGILVHDVLRGICSVDFLVLVRESHPRMRLFDFCCGHASVVLVEMIFRIWGASCCLRG